MVVQISPTSVDLARLRSWAAEFDQEAGGACWPASRFVEWVELNVAPRRDSSEIRRAGQRGSGSNGR